MGARERRTAEDVENATARGRERGGCLGAEYVGEREARRATGLRDKGVEQEEDGGTQMRASKGKRRVQTGKRKKEMEEDIVDGAGNEPGRFGSSLHLALGDRRRTGAQMEPFWGSATRQLLLHERRSSDDAARTC